MTAHILIKLIKPLLKRTLYREDSVCTILWGPARGLRYRVFSFGLAPIYGGWEPEAQRLMDRYIRSGATAYDIGANHGIHTLLMARKVGEGGQIYAFEPVPGLRRCLEDNVRMNNFSNVECVEAAVCDRAGTQAFALGRNEAVGHLSSAGRDSGELLMVRTLTLDQFVFVERHNPPEFIKMDIEGSEADALAGGIRVLKTHRPVLLADLHSPEQDEAVGRILMECSYRAYRIGKNGSTREIRDLRKPWPDPEGIWGQIIAFPKEWRDEPDRGLGQTPPKEIRNEPRQSASGSHGSGPSVVFADANVSQIVATGIPSRPR